jgi:uncharacterized SAM-binding protein YcdF (DUF218 family)
MFFVAAKIFWALFQPSNLAAILAASGLITLMIWRRLGLTLLAAAGMLLVIFGILPTGQWLIAPLEARFARPSDEAIKTAAGLIVLGGTEQPGMTRSRGEPSLGFEAARLAGAAALAHRLADKPVLYSGGYREPGGTTQIFCSASASPERDCCWKTSPRTPPRTPSTPRKCWGSERLSHGCSSLRRFICRARWARSSAPA